MPESGIDKATDLALSNPYWNPRPLERQGIRNLIARAWAGEEPRIRPLTDFRAIGPGGDPARFSGRTTMTSGIRPDRPAPVHQDDGAAGAGVAMAPLFAPREGGRHAEARLRQPADRAARRLRRGRRVHPRPVPREREERARHRRHQLCRRGGGEGLAVQPQPRRRGRQGADRRRRDRPDAGRLDAGDHQPGVDAVRDRGGALHLDHGAVAALVHRPPGQSAATRRAGSPSSTPSTISGGSRT